MTLIEANGRKRHAGTNGHLEPRPLEKPPQGGGYLLRRAVVSSGCGKEKNVAAILGKPTQARRLSEDALAPVPEDGVSEPFRSDEGDPSGHALVARCHADSQELVVEPPPT